MIAIFVLVITLALFLMVFTVVVRAVIAKQQIFGRPPIPVFFFVLAKMLVVVNLLFLLLKGLGVGVYRMFEPVPWVDLVALASLILGTIILVLSTVRLNKDLIFGLSSSEQHQLQTTGIFSISRHPFYLGFLFILFSSCLFYPNPVNILSFLGAWIIHHVIMIREEKFLVTQYGDQYREYMANVNRYLTFKSSRP